MTSGPTCRATTCCSSSSNTPLPRSSSTTFKPGTTGSPTRSSTPVATGLFNFIQLLSEIAKEHPDLLVLVVSVRNGSTDAFQQIQRVEPILVDFKGPTAKQDRQKLLLHRLFENRTQVPESIDEHIRSNLFIPEDFDALVLAAADNNESVGKLLRELQEPRPSGASCIPWLGALLMKERVIRICTRGDIAINLRGMEYLQLRADEDEEDAWKRMRGKLGTGKHLDETYVLRPQAVPHTEGVSKPAPEPKPDGGLFGRSTGNDEQATGNEEGGMGGTSPTPPDGGGSIFGGGSDLIPHATGATSALNLLGKVESWGIATGSQVQDMSLKISSLTGAQLNKLLRGLPDGITYELSLNKEKK